MPLEDLTHILCCRADVDTTLCGLATDVPEFKLDEGREIDEVLLDPDLDPCIVCLDLHEGHCCPVAEDGRCDAEE